MPGLLPYQSLQANLVSSLQATYTNPTVMSTQVTHENAETKYAQVNGRKIAYRNLGRTEGVPMIMLIHFRGNMDLWDPKLINRLAQDRPLILMDSPGTGRSEGPVPDTFPGWAEFAAGLVKVLGHEKVDVFGFSMSGFVAESFAVYHPELVRKLILAGTGAPMNDEFTAGELPLFMELAGAEGDEAYKLAHEHTFWPPTAAGKAGADASWDRIQTRRADDRVTVLSAKAAEAQVASYMAWLEDKELWGKLKALTIPVLIANGNDDLLIPTYNSWVLSKNISRSYLHIYPEAGHAFLYQHADLFAADVTLFLDTEGI